MEKAVRWPSLKPDESRSFLISCLEGFQWACESAQTKFGYTVLYPVKLRNVNTSRKIRIENQNYVGQYNLYHNIVVTEPCKYEWLTPFIFLWTREGLCGRCLFMLISWPGLRPFYLTIALVVAFPLPFIGVKGY